MKRSTCLLMLTIVAAVHFVLAATVPPADDELYYWCWSQDLQASYFDHPPMTALLIRASTSLFGHTLFGLRFPACLCALATLFLIGHLTDRRGIGWLLATPMIAFGSILITPDAPVLLIWTAYAIWLIAIQKPERSHRWVWWLAGGVLLGLGGLSKYTMALAVPGALLSFMLNRDPKQAAWRLGFVCHLVVCLMVMSPIFLFNMQHDFRPMQFQLNHAAEKSGPLHPFRIFEFIGGQVLLVGLMPFLLLPWCLRHRRELGADSRLRISLWLFVFPSLIENSPNILLEAMAHGVPVIASAAAPMPEFGGTAIGYFDPLSVDSIRQSIEQALTDRTDRAVLASACRAQAARFTWDRFTARVVALYRSVLG